MSAYGYTYPHHPWLLACGLSVHLLPPGPGVLNRWTVSTHDTSTDA